MLNDSNATEQTIKNQTQEKEHREKLFQMPFATHFTLLLVCAHT